MGLFKWGWRYDTNQEPEESLYGLMAKIDRRHERTLSAIAGLTRETCQLVVDIARSNWSVDSPAGANQPPGVDSGNLDSSARIYERDLTGRFSSSSNAKSSTIIWDTRTGSNYHGRGEYAAVQEYGLDGLITPHPFLGPAISEVENGFLRRMLDSLK